MEELTITPPTGMKIARVDLKDGKAIAVLEKEEKKDLQWYWNGYKTWRESHNQNPLYSWDVDPSLWNEEWPILVDFYRWLAEELDKGLDDLGICVYEIYYYKLRDMFKVHATNIAISIPITHRSESTARLAIDILGEDLLKKIFQVK